MDRLIALLQQDAAFRLWYVAGGFVLIIAPMLMLAIWYHGSITRSAGGRSLMKRQNANRPRAKAGLLNARAQLGEAA
jgi:hypothetical protein